MARLTVQKENGGYAVPEAQWQQAVEKLAKLENMCEALRADQEKTVAKLAKLRDASKQKTVKSRELLAQKLYNTNMLNMLKVYGLEE